MTYHGENLSDSGQAGAPKSGEIEITPQMIEAGLYELYDHRFGEDIRLVLEDVFRAMAYLWLSQGSDLASSKRLLR